MNKKIEDLLESCVEVVDRKNLEKKLKEGQTLRIKFGADPSRPDLHLGHTVPLRALKHLQDMGHKIIFVIGDFTGMIGDPSGKSKARPALSFEETRKNGESYFNQVFKILDKDKVEIRYNSEWFGNIKFEDVLKLASKYTVARILERDDFKNRFNNNMPIGIHEFMYPLMQGYDSVVLDADVEVGGSDQIFNLLVGRELKKQYNLNTQDIMAFPLLVGLDGKEKMSKSLDNYIGVSDKPEKMYEKAMKIKDETLRDYFILTTDIDKEKIDKIINGDIFKAHEIYAEEIIRMYHGEEYIEEAKKRYKQVANGEIPDIIETIKLDKKIFEEGILLLDLLKEINMTSSKSEGKRLVEQGGIKINNNRVDLVDKIINYEDFVNNELVLKKGKKEFKKIII